MADLKTPVTPEKNDKKGENAFVRVMKAIFVRDIVLKLVALGITAVLWCVSVGLGVAHSSEAFDAIDFFPKFGQNIVAEFASVGRIIVSVIDIALLFAVVYTVLVLLRKNNSSPLAKFLVLLVITVLVLASPLIGFPVMGSVFGYGFLLIIIAVLAMFPQELRRALIKVASRSENVSFQTDYDSTEEELREAVDDIVKAVLNMSKDNCGALILLTTQTLPKHILESGTALGARLSQPLIECLFNTNADLHDGAVFIRGNKILAAGCFLPLSQNQSLPKELGTRHRAALGVTEQYDVLAIVVSEETGIISVAKDGKLDRYYDAVMLADVIEQVFGLKAAKDTKKKRGRR